MIDTTVDQLCLYKERYGLVRKGAPQRPAVGTFDVCLTRPKACPTDIVRPHAAKLMIDSCQSILQIYGLVRIGYYSGARKFDSSRKNADWFTRALCTDHVYAT